MVQKSVYGHVYVCVCVCVCVCIQVGTEASEETRMIYNWNTSPTTTTCKFKDYVAVTATTGRHVVVVVVYIYTIYIIHRHRHTHTRAWGLRETFSTRRSTGGRTTWAVPFWELRRIIIRERETDVVRMWRRHVPPAALCVIIISIIIFENRFPDKFRFFS